MIRKNHYAAVEDGAVYVLKAGVPLYIKTDDICAMTGKSRQWIGQLVNQGVLIKQSTPRGPVFEAITTMRAYCDMLETRADEAALRVSAAGDELNEAEIRIKKSKAVMLELEASELQGKMHRSEDVASMTEDLIYTIRGMLLALPGRLAIDAASLNNSAEVSELIRVEVYRVMDELARYRYDSQKYRNLVREQKKRENLTSEEEPDEKD